MATSIARTDAGEWSRVPPPRPGTSSACVFEWEEIDDLGPDSLKSYESVTAAGEDRVWVAGWRYGGDGVKRALVRRWNGSKWKTERTPKWRNQDVILRSIDAGRRGKPVTGGYRLRPSETYSLALGRRPGGNWPRRDGLETELEGASFYDVASTGDLAWAVGAEVGGTGIVGEDFQYYSTPLIYNRYENGWFYDGLGVEGLLNGVWGESNEFGMAVGVREKGGGARRTLAMKWVNYRWWRMESPNFNGLDHAFTDVEGSGRNVWVIGRRELADSGTRPFAAHWRGGEWTLETLPVSDDASINAVSVHEDDVVLVGTDSYSPVLLMRSGSSWESFDLSQLSLEGIRDVDHLSKGTIVVNATRFSSGHEVSVVLSGKYSCEGTEGPGESPLPLPSLSTLVPSP